MAHARVVEVANLADVGLIAPWRARRARTPPSASAADRSCRSSPANDRPRTRRRRRRNRSAAPLGAAQHRPAPSARAARRCPIAVRATGSPSRRRRAMGWPRHRRAPKPERAVRTLAIKQLRRRILHAARDARIALPVRLPRQRVVIQQRHRHRGQLFGAPVRIALQRIQQRRWIDAGEVGERNQRLRAGWNVANASPGARHEALAACGCVSH